MFLDALEKLHQWKLKNLPASDTPQGTEILLWILKHATPDGKLKDLYRSSRYSEPTVRARLHEFVSQGLISIELDASDSRKHIIRPTEKLQILFDEYALRLDEAASASVRGPDDHRRA